MSMLGDAYSALRQVMLLDEHIKELRADVAAIKADAKSTRDRISRLEGMFEMAMYKGSRRLDHD